MTFTGFSIITPNSKSFSRLPGSIIVDGHELHEEDLRLMYTFDQKSGTAAQYEAHSDGQVMCSLPDF